MLEVRQFSKGGKVELVSDDKNGENAIVEEALEGLPVGMRWAEAEMEDGEVVIEIKPDEFGMVGDALAGSDYCWDAASALDELAGARSRE